MDKVTIVLAKYKEDTSWADAYDSVFVVEKGVHLPNEGREPTSYLWYIMENYDSLEGKYFFLQGDPRDHCPGIAKELGNTEGDFRWFSERANYTCDMMGRPHDNVDLRAFLNACGIEYDKNNITFTGCCLFMISADKLKSKPKEYYQKVYDAVVNTPRGAYAFERTLELIFN
jgi:hypothetical protein